MASVNFTLVKRHPVATGVIVLIGGVILFMLYRNHSSGDVSAEQSGSTMGYDVTDAQTGALQGGVNLQAGQQASQVQIAELEAAVANNQTLAALEATKINAERDQNITGITSTADVAKAQISSDTAIDIAHTQAHAYEAAIDASTEQAKIAADAAVDISHDNTAAKLQIDNSVIGLVKSGQLNKGGSGGAHQAAVISEVLGFSGDAAEREGAVAASGSSPAAILSGVANIGKSILGGLFG
jgi:hypothetical protein